MLSTNRFHRLVGAVRHYAWGQSLQSTGGHCPYIPQLLGEDPGAQPWAELWLGAHPSLPSALADGTSLPDAIAQSPSQWLGPHGGSQLAYLFKVLSCSHALSIQSHPDEHSAIRLHAAHPELYPDPHDKTEIIIALTAFEAMAGFREDPQIRASLESIAPLAEALLAPWQSGPEAESLRGLCQVIFGLSQDAVTALSAALRAHAASVPAITDAEELFCRLDRQYPDDRGALFAFLLNHKRLCPGESLFLAPNSPHAYICGTGIECMTNSDNVIRAGLTGKAIDVPTLLATVDFSRHGAEAVAPASERAGQGEILSYNPPTPKFQLKILNDAPLELQSCPEGLGMLLVLSGEMRLTDDFGENAAPRGSCWVRPSALRNGRAVPTAGGTRAAWVQTGFAPARSQADR